MQTDFNRLTLIFFISDKACTKLYKVCHLPCKNSTDLYVGEMHFRSWDQMSISVQFLPARGFVFSSPNQNGHDFLYTFFELQMLDTLTMKNFLAIFLFLGIISFAQHSSAITLTPEDFGAVIDDGKPDDVAFQAMFNSIPTKERNVIITLRSGEYLFDQTVFYPKYNRRRMMIEGNHGTLKAVGLAFDILAPASIKGEAMQTALDNMDKLIVNDLSFEGGDTQLTLIATLTRR
ncbi:MAG: hypothetical protein ACI93E_000978 [Flavobacteriales bacterium]|jgi:hypothetical protein